MESGAGCTAGRHRDLSRHVRRRGRRGSRSTARAEGAGRRAVPVRPQTFRPLGALLRRGRRRDVERGKAATAGDSVMPTAKSARGRATRRPRARRGEGCGAAVDPAASRAVHA